MYGPGVPYHPFYTCGVHWYDLFLVVNLKAVDPRLGFSNRSTSKAYDSSTMSKSSLILILFSSERMLLGPSVLAFHDTPAKKGEACLSHLGITTTFLFSCCLKRKRMATPLLSAAGNPTMGSLLLLYFLFFTSFSFF